jgi:hypothetical protein
MTSTEELVERLGSVLSVRPITLRVPQVYADDPNPWGAFADDIEAMLAQLTRLAILADDRPDPTEGLPGKLLDVASTAADGRLLGGGEIELIVEGALALQAAEANITRLAGERDTLPPRLTDAQRELLEDKFVLWDKASRAYGSGPDADTSRDYNRRAAGALKAALAICSEAT